MFNIETRKSTGIVLVTLLLHLNTLSTVSILLLTWILRANGRFSPIESIFISCLHILNVQTLTAFNFLLQNKHISQSCLNIKLR